MSDDLPPWEGEPDFPANEAPKPAIRGGEPTRVEHPYVGRQIKAKRACHRCGYELVTLTEPKGPHSYGLRCSGCLTHVGWLSAADTSRLDANT